MNNCSRPAAAPLLRTVQTSIVIATMTMVAIAQSTVPSSPPEHYRKVLNEMIMTGLSQSGAFEIVTEITTKAPNRLFGSPGVDTAIGVAAKIMSRRALENIRLEAVPVPRWIRGTREEAVATINGKERIALSISALGGSIGTSQEGIRAEVLEVKSFDELNGFAENAKGKIILFNRPMNERTFNSFRAYAEAVNQRNLGAIQAARHGAVGVLVRSMTQRIDNIPHTGGVAYVDSIPMIPAAAISTRDAELISTHIAGGASVSVSLNLDCRSLPDVQSSNVMGEIVGSDRPEEVVLVGAHIDSWDKGTGAHDNAAGCSHVIEALTLIKKLGLKPKRTIRAVLFMNEEYGAHGANAYAIAPARSGEIQFAAVESDRGGFAPRAFQFEGDSTVTERILAWKSLFESIGIHEFRKGFSGVDIQPLVRQGVAGFGLQPEDHRYFDYHHSMSDTIDKIHPRELQLGAISVAFLAYLLSEI